MLLGFKKESLYSEVHSCCWSLLPVATMYWSPLPVHSPYKVTRKNKHHIITAVQRPRENITGELQDHGYLGKKEKHPCIIRYPVLSSGKKCRNICYSFELPAKHHRTFFYFTTLPGKRTWMDSDRVLELLCIKHNHISFHRKV